MKSDGGIHFQIEKQSSNSRARATTFNLNHGKIQTPVFMPVGTRATVRAQTRDSIDRMNPQIVLANTYHLMLSPGIEVFEKLGGIHKFMNWDRPILTDSGGFQIFSLEDARTIDDTGAQFRDHRNGNRIILTPEKSIQMQKAIGSDVVMVLDQCVNSTVDHATAVEAMNRTHAWAERSLREFGDSPNALFGIIQGANHFDLRKQSIETLENLIVNGRQLSGLAIGGLAVGESKSEREDVTEFVTSLMPNNKPRYLMGVGTPIDLLEAVHRGVDMFDCVLPTSFAQQGLVFTSKGRVNIKRSIYKFDQSKLDENCECITCLRYSKDYLQHLSRTEEVYGWHLLGQHNLHFYLNLMKEIREKIFNDQFYNFYTKMRPILSATDGPGEVQKIRKKDSKLEVGNYEISFSKDKYARIKQKSSGEIMHPISDPNEEVHKIYIEQSRFAEKIRTDFNQDSLVIWDVGLGAAHNAMAAIHTYEKIFKNNFEKTRSVEMISFENDIDSLKLSLYNPGYFSHIRHAAPNELLKNNSWSKNGFKWRLKVGNFLEEFINEKIPDVIFYDPFSFKTDTELWTLDTFQKLAHFCKGKRRVELYTYSNSTGVRAALLGAGFSVAKGIATGPKSETTIAILGELESEKLLDKEWFKKWDISSSKFPYGLNKGYYDQFESLIRSNKQFI